LNKSIEIWSHDDQNLNRGGESKQNFPALKLPLKVFKNLFFAVRIQPTDGMPKLKNGCIPAGMTLFIVRLKPIQSINLKSIFAFAIFNSTIRIFRNKKTFFI